MLQMKKRVLAGLMYMLLAGGAIGRNRIEKWDVFELTLKGPSTGNPFMGTSLVGRFTNGS
jgi:hypothetical protein